MLNFLNQKKGINYTIYKIGNSKWELNIETKNIFLNPKRVLGRFLCKYIWKRRSKRFVFFRQIQINKIHPVRVESTKGPISVREQSDYFQKTQDLDKSIMEFYQTFESQMMLIPV